MKVLQGEILKLLALHFNGETTINQMRIGHYIGLKSLYERSPTSNKDISNALDIPRSTVSRIIADYVEKGWVVEQPDPEDGRRKHLFIPPDHPLADHFEKAFRCLINDLLSDFEAGQIVPVDADREGY